MAHPARLARHASWPVVLAGRRAAADVEFGKLAAVTPAGEGDALEVGLEPALSRIEGAEPARHARLADGPAQPVALDARARRGVSARQQNRPCAQPS